MWVDSCIFYEYLKPNFATIALPRHQPSKKLLMKNEFYVETQLISNHGLATKIIYFHAFTERLYSDAHVILSINNFNVQIGGNKME